MLGHIVPGEKADAANHDEGDNDQVDQRIRGIAGEGGEGAGAALEVKTGVAEGGDGVKDAVPQPLGKAQLGDKPDGQQQGPQPLDADGAPQNPVGHLQNAAHLGGGDGLLHNPPLLEPDLPAGEHGDGHCHSDDPHTADLDQDEDNQLAKDAPVLDGVVDHQAGDAGGGGGGEQGVQEGGPLPRPAGPGQAEQQRAGQNDQKKAQDDHPGRRDTLQQSRKHRGTPKRQKLRMIHTIIMPRRADCNERISPEPGLEKKSTGLPKKFGASARRKWPARPSKGAGYYWTPSFSQSVSHFPVSDATKMISRVLEGTVTSKFS